MRVFFGCMNEWQWKGQMNLMVRSWNGIGLIDDLCAGSFMKGIRLLVNNPKFTFRILSIPKIVFYSCLGHVTHTHTYTCNCNEIEWPSMQKKKVMKWKTSSNFLWRQTPFLFSSYLHRWFILFNCSFRFIRLSVSAGIAQQHTDTNPPFDCVREVFTCILSSPSIICAPVTYYHLFAFASISDGWVISKLHRNEW